MWLVLMWGLAACSPGAEIVLEPGVVARIDSTSISAAEMRNFVVQMPQSLRLQDRMTQCGSATCAVCWASPCSY